MELRDSPAVVSVLTREFLDDIAATTLAETSIWATNAMPLANNVEAVSGEYQVRFRGMGAGFPTRNYFKWYVDSDDYNTERFEFARGPNGVLFGDGNVSGIATTWTKRASVDQARHVLAARTDSYGGYRVTFDVNQPLVSQKFALRVNGLVDRTKGWRDYASSDRNGLYLTGLFRITRTMNFRFDGEYGDIERYIFTQNFTDYASYWNGTTTTNSSTGTLINLPPAPQPGFTHGLQRLGPTFGGSYFLWVPSMSGLNVTNWGNMVQTNGTGAPLLEGQRTDIAAEVSGRFPVLPYREFNIQPLNSIVHNKYHTFSAFLDKSFGHWLFLEAAFNRSDRKSDAWDNSALWQEYHIDVNRVLPNGQPNPKFGVPYTDQTRGFQYGQNLVDEGRFLATALFENRRIRQRITAIAGVLEESSYQINTRPRLVNKTTGVNSKLWERYYWDEPVSVAGAMPELTDANLDLRWMPTLIQRNERYVKSAQLLGITQFLRERLTVIYGMRYDDYENRIASATTPFPTPEPVGRNISYAAPTSLSAGAVWYFLEGIGAFANYSESFNAPRTGPNLLNGSAPDIMRNEGVDVGFRFELFNKKIVGSVSYYSNEQQNSPNDGYTNSFVTELNRLWVNSGHVDPFIRYRDTRDFKGTGYELDMTANPSKNLRIIFNLALPETEAVNLRPGLKQYFAENLPVWQAAIDKLSSSDDDQTKKAQMLTDVERIRDAIKSAAKGAVLPQTIKYSANVYGTYSFTSDALRSLEVGFGSNIRGKNNIGAPDVNRPFDYAYAKAYQTYSAHMSYRVKIGDKRPLRLQVNISNLFDNDDAIVYGTQAYRLYGQSANPRLTAEGAYYYMDPRKITFSASYLF